MIYSYSIFNILKAFTLCMLGIFRNFWSSAKFFFKSFFSKKKSFRNNIYKLRVSSSLDPDVGPYVLQRLSTYTLAAIGKELRHYVTANLNKSI